jgi:hypothetical protein
MIEIYDNESTNLEGAFYIAAVGAEDESPMSWSERIETITRLLGKELLAGGTPVGEIREEFAQAASAMTKYLDDVNLLVLVSVVDDVLEEIGC